MSDARLVPVPQYMRTTEPHITVGAYALGVPGGADTFRFEEHLGSAGGVGGGPVEVAGGAALRPEAIDHFEVRTADGRRLVTVTR
ncbi:hypothetical protein [Streptomyces anulatus]|uniref:Uncharacterized protein n=1 Tax=Streptomyces anulatus TaxID=1892 RepID=A0ABZ1ZUU8_STRAQ|nr:hypothetical protein [Streptomyces anulatus]